MKKPKWNKRSTLIILREQKVPQEVHGSDFDVPVSVGMKVHAQYNETTVVLKITEVLDGNHFQAEILSDLPDESADFKRGETVLIDEEDICCKVLH